MEERLSDLGARRVARLDLGVVLVTIPMVAWLSTSTQEVSVPTAVAVALLFLMAEWFPIDVEIREQGHTVAFTAVPLIVGLCLLPPVLVIGLRVAASIFVLGLVHRQAPLKFTTNVVSHAFQVAVAATVMMPFIDGAPEGIAEWGIAAVAVLAAEAAGTAVVAAAISLWEGEFDREFLDGTLTGWTVLVPDAALGIITAIVIGVDPAAVVLLALVGVSLAVVVRAYARITLRYRVLEVLDSFTEALGAAVVAGDLHATMLGQIGDRLHAGTAWMQLPDQPDLRIVWQGAGHPLRSEPLVDRDVGDDGSSIVGTVPAGDQDLLLGVEDRLGEVRAFDREDQRLFHLLAAHAGVALQNVRLVDQLRHEARINEDLATRDQLTGLPNRTLFLRDLQRSSSNAEVMGVLLLGIDRFKEVNDTLGHHHGDELLVDVGRRLQQTVARDVSIARLGGDEFAIRWAAHDHEELLVRAMAVLDAVNGLYRVGGMDLEVTLSGGLTSNIDSSADPVTLLRQADIAMYLAKSDRVPLVSYAADRDTSSPARLAMAGRLRTAIDAGDLTLQYQPQIDLTSGRVVGVEALVRWTPEGQRHPVSPVEFIDVAERTGLIHPLTRLVVDQALAQAATWARQGIDLRVSANLSPRNLEDPTLVDDLEGLLATHRVDPRRFEVEVTETSVMLDPDAAIATLRRIHDLGVSISIDDFGTGHSSLAYLTQLPVDQLKIDRSFVMELTTPGSGPAVVHAIIDLGRHLGLEIVAEGVETAAHIDLLTAMGADLGQGYVFARPLVADDVAGFIARCHAELEETPARIVDFVRPA